MIKGADRTRVSKFVAVEMQYYNTPFAFTVLQLCGFMLTLMAVLFTIQKSIMAEDPAHDRQFLVWGVLLLVAFVASVIAYGVLSRAERADYSAVMLFSAGMYILCAAAGILLSRAVWGAQIEENFGSASAGFLKDVFLWCFWPALLVAAIYVAFLFVPVRHAFTRMGKWYIVSILVPTLILPALIVAMRMRTDDTIIRLAVATTAGYVALMLCFAVRYVFKAWMYRALTRPERAEDVATEQTPPPEQLPQDERVAEDAQDTGETPAPKAKSKKKKAAPPPAETKDAEELVQGDPEPETKAQDAEPPAEEEIQEAAESASPDEEEIQEAAESAPPAEPEEAAEQPPARPKPKKKKASPKPQDKQPETSGEKDSLSEETKKEPAAAEKDSAELSGEEEPQDVAEKAEPAPEEDGAKPPAPKPKKKSSGKKKTPSQPKSTKAPGEDAPAPDAPQE